MGIRYSALPGHTDEMATALNDVLSIKWGELRGIEIVSFGVSSVKANEEDEKMIEHLLRKMIGVGDKVELDDNLKETPHRVLKLWTEMTEGYREDQERGC